jgi:hypothetical protein
MIPKKSAAHLMRGGHRLSEKIIPGQKPMMRPPTACRSSHRMFDLARIAGLWRGFAAGII